MRVTPPEPSWVRSGRIPCLDGFRAVAILLVLLAHFLARPDLPADNPILRAGHFGVTLFFVLSGLLITLLLIRERDAEGRIDLPAFYVRRVLRIMPAFFAFLGVMLALQSLHLFRIPLRYWAAAGGYWMCYMPDLRGAWMISHTWSLSVEEHFYLLWPALFALLPRRRAVAALCAYLAAVPALRFLGSRAGIDIDFASFTQMGSIAVGCLLALVTAGEAFPWLTAALRRHGEALFFAGALLVVLSPAVPSGKYQLLLGDPAVATGMGLVMVGLMHDRRILLHPLLNHPAPAALGAISYSLYLWQQAFLGHSALAPHLPNPAVGLVLAFGAAWASYRFVERPCLRLKDRLAGRAQPVPAR